MSLLRSRVRSLVRAVIAASLLVMQFVVVYLRVLPYLSSTFGRDACLYQAFLWLGFPLGMLLLDVSRSRIPTRKLLRII